MRTLKIPDFANKFFRVTFLTDFYGELTTFWDKIRIASTILLNITDTAFKLLGPYALAECVEALNDEKEEVNFFGVSMTPKKLIFATVILNLCHHLMSDIKKLAVHGICESISTTLSERVNRKAALLALETQKYSRHDIINLTYKHLASVNNQIYNLLSASTENLHPLLFDIIIGVIFTFSKVGYFIGGTLLIYIFLSMLMSELLTYCTNLPAKQNIELLLFSNFFSQASESVNNAETIFFLKRDELELKNLHCYYSLYNTQKMQNKITEKLWILQSVLICAMQLLAAFYVSRDDFNDIDLDEMLFLFNYVINIGGNLSSITSIYRSSLTSIESFDEVTRFLAQPVEILTKTENHPDNASEDEAHAFFQLVDNTVQADDPPIYLPLDAYDEKSAIIFDNVSFVCGKDTILNSINLSIPAGKTVAFVGETGCGKTTLTKLMLGLLKPSNNDATIKFFGRPVHEISLDELSGKVSVVSQDVTIFPKDSVRYNILYGFAAESDLHAMKFSHNQLNHAVGLDSERDLRTSVDSTCLQKITDRTDCYGLSGGEAQRVGISRILSRHSSLFIFDEPTSKLDSKIEAKVLRNIRAALVGKTVIMIAHRLSTIMHADTIFVLKNDGTGGRIAEQGTHQELLDMRGEYAELWEIQTHGIALDVAPPLAP